MSNDGKKVAVTLRRDDAQPGGEPSDLYLSKKSLGHDPATANHDFIGQRLGRATSRRSEMATLQDDKPTSLIRC
jgi:hypothetical protein